MTSRSETRVALCAAALLLAHCAGGSDAPGGSTGGAGKLGVAGEQQVFYQDVIEAYEAGDPRRGRELAKAHVERVLPLLRGARDAVSREAEARQILVLSRYVLQSEAAFEPLRRWQDPVFRQALTGAIDEALATCRALEPAAHVQQYLERELGLIGRDLLRVEDGLSSRQELQAIFRKFEPELRKMGVESVDAALADGRRSRAPLETPPPVRMGEADGAKLLVTVREYFAALVTANEGRLAATTRLDANACRELLEAAARDLAEEGIREIHEIRLPEISPTQMELDPLGTPEHWALHLRGLEYDVTLNDGSRITRVGNKRLKVRFDGSSQEWLIIPSGQDAG